jgi:hypothetical protein
LKSHSFSVDPGIALLPTRSDRWLGQKLWIAFAVAFRQHIVEHDAVPE